MPTDTQVAPEPRSAIAPPGRTIYLSEAIAQARHAAEALATAYPDLADDEVAWIDTLDGVTDAIDVADRLIRRSMARARLAEAAKAEQADIAARATRFAAQAEATRNAALAILSAALPPDGKGRIRLERPSYTASVRTAPPKVLVTDEHALPPTMTRQPPPEPDKAAIKAALTAGKNVPGAILSNGTPYLEVRTR